MGSDFGKVFLLRKRLTEGGIESPGVIMGNTPGLRAGNFWAPETQRPVEVARLMKAKVKKKRPLKKSDK